jgi:cardiolipin synthase
MKDFIVEHYWQGLALIGLCTILFILAALFTSLTEESVEIASSAPVPVGSAEFKRAVEGIANASARPATGPITTFNDGTDFLADLLREFDQAERSITITNYIFREGVMAGAVLDALTRAAKRGVLVRLLLDDHGASHAPEDKLEALQAAGGAIARFRPVSFRTITRVYRRTHVRAIAVDGKTGYFGGLAFNDEWLGSGLAPGEWRDLMFKVSGPMARAVQDQFGSLWRQTDGEILAGEAFYPNGPAEQARSTSQGQAWYVPLLHAPAPDISSDLLDLIWLTIAGARDHIYLATPYLTPPDEIVQALAEAVQRGVAVEVLVPGPYTDTKLVQSATRSYYEELLDAGVKVYEYQPGRFHEKFLTADGEWSLVGSANMDNRSATLNVENVFGIEDPAFAHTLEQEFAFGKAHALERTRENFRPTIFKKLYYHLIALFAKQF